MTYFLEKNVCFLYLRNVHDYDTDLNDSVHIIKMNKEFVQLNIIKNSRELEKILKFTINKWIQKNKNYLVNTCSDEVGVGDYFAPLVCTTVKLKSSDYENLDLWRTFDSKKLSQNTILSLGKSLSKIVKHKSIILTNQKYNDLISRGFNAHVIKTYIHLLNLKNIKPEGKTIIDKYAAREKMLEYTEKINKMETQNFTFSKNYLLIEKADSLFRGAAIASIIARYHFLMFVEEQNKKLDIETALGASNLVDKQVRELYKKHGEEILNFYTKKHFKNTIRVKEQNDR